MLGYCVFMCRVPPSTALSNVASAPIDPPSVDDSNFNTWAQLVAEPSAENYGSAQQELAASAPPLGADVGGVSVGVLNDPSCLMVRLGPSEISKTPEQVGSAATQARSPVSSHAEPQPPDTVGRWTLTAERTVNARGQLARPACSSRMSAATPSASRRSRRA